MRAKPAPGLPGGLSARVFGRDDCPFSRMAAELAGAALEPTPGMPADLSEAALAAGHRPGRVPVCFVDGEYVGGATDLALLCRRLRDAEAAGDVCSPSIPAATLASARFAGVRCVPPRALALAGLSRAQVRAEASRARCAGSHRCALARLAPALERAAFAPAGPSRGTAWLSNHDIEAVMRPYEAAHPRFRFVGALPSDVRGPTVKELAAGGFTRFAAVFNTDPTGKPGRHWVCAFGVIDRASPRLGVYYFDSARGRAPAKVMAYLRACAAELGLKGVSANASAYQSGDSECGVFCIHLIDRMLKTNRSFEAVCDGMRGDKAMNALRSLYFNAAR